MGGNGYVQLLGRNPLYTGSQGIKLGHELNHLDSNVWKMIFGFIFLENVHVFPLSVFRANHHMDLGFFDSLNQLDWYRMLLLKSSEARCKSHYFCQATRPRSAGPAFGNARRGPLGVGSMVGGPLEDRDATVDGSEIRLTTWDVYQNFRKEWDSHYKPQLKLRMVGRWSVPLGPDLFAGAICMLVSGMVVGSQ